jgi:hypothetical protein
MAWQQQMMLCNTMRMLGGCFGRPIHAPPWHVHAWPIHLLMAGPALTVQNKLCNYV